MQFYHSKLDDISKEALRKRLEDYELENEMAKGEKIDEAAKKKSEAGITGIDPKKKERDNDPGGIDAGWEKQRAEELGKIFGTPQERAKKTAQTLVSRLQAKGRTTGYLEGIAKAAKESPTKEEKPSEVPTQPEPEKSVYQRQREIASELMKKRRGTLPQPEPEKSVYQLQRERASELMKKRRSQAEQQPSVDTSVKGVADAIENRGFDERGNLKELHPEHQQAYINNKEAVENELKRRMQQKTEAQPKPSVETPKQAPIQSPVDTSSKKSSFKDFVRKAGEKISGGVADIGGRIAQRAKADKRLLNTLKDIWSSPNPYAKKKTSEVKTEGGEKSARPSSPNPYAPFKDNPNAKDHFYVNEKPYYLHVKYRIKYEDGKDEIIYERVPFTALSDEHAKEKRHDVFTNFQNKVKYLEDKDYSEGKTKRYNFEMGGHYNQKRGRSFQFYLSPDKGHGKTINAPEQYDPTKSIFNQKNPYAAPKKVTADEMKPQLVTVHHRSKTEAEKIAKDIYRSNNLYPEETPIKVHASHWV
jgi:hypothetical protein